MHRFDAAATAALLDFPHLITALTKVLQEYDAGEIICPERLVVPCGGGHGLLLSMPCHARDLVVHKLLTVYGSNPSRGLPAIQGEVACFDAAATALTQTPDFSRPIFFKSVGCAAWDLAACRAAQSRLGQSGGSVDPRSVQGAELGAPPSELIDHR